jgi:ATPase family associated with various cellular activities (AAA)
MIDGGLHEALDRLDRMLARAVDRAVAAQSGQRPDPFRGLYVSAGDAAGWAQTPRAAPILGVAGVEQPLAEIVDPLSVLGSVARTHRLSGFDIDLLLIALAPEVDLRYGRIYAFLQDDVSRRGAGVDLALTLLCATPDAKLARREHLAPDAPLLRGGLVEVVPDPDALHASLLAGTMKVDDTVVRRLLSLGGLDPRLRTVATMLDPDEPPGDAADPALAALVAGAFERDEPLRLYFSGPPTPAKRGAAHAVAAAAGAPVLAVDLLEAAAPVWELATREAALHGALLYLEPLDELREAEPPAGLRRLARALASYRGVVVLAGTRADAPRGEGLEGLVQIPFAVPAHDERLTVWTAALDAEGVRIAEAEVVQLADRFRLTPDQIADAVAVARNRARMEAQPVTVERLLAAARTRSDVAPSSLAQKIEPVHEWADLVLPDDTEAQLREMRQRVVARHQVLEEWGFGRRHMRGKGISALFAGPSGTGKTTAAEIIAGELGLDLLKVDLSGVVSKYIGETEKNLQRVFAIAEAADAILFFDEADALFGKRSEVRDSHDRYANIEIAYLLERMERYEGIAILATNLRQNMDDAFVRRLQFIVEFPFPTEQERERIWELQFPDEADRDDDIDFASLARQFRVAGGSIRNIVLGAAFLAAAEGRPIGMRELLHATRREYHKLGRVLGAAELGPYAELVPS